MGERANNRLSKKYYKYLKNELYLTNYHLDYKISVSVKHNL